jgi:hypothetical protein
MSFHNVRSENGTYKLGDMHDLFVGSHQSIFKTRYHLQEEIEYMMLSALPDMVP